MLTKDEHGPATSAVPAAGATNEDEARAAARTQVTRVPRLKFNAAAWILGTVLLTALWVLTEWQANGAFERFGSEGTPGDWSPTLWALGVGIWGLAVGIMALRVHFERPTTAAEVDRELERLRRDAPANAATTDAELRRFARVRLDGIRRLKFHVGAWVLGMIVATPLWALIEWQDNGGFERWSASGRPGDWEPWILYVGGVWALVIAVLAVHLAFDRPTTEAEIDAQIERLDVRR
jgi:hypothetical protein